MKTDVKTRLLIILISVSLIPMTILFLYAQTSFSKHYGESILQNNELVKESNVKSLVEFLYRVEYVSNFAYNESIQDILIVDELYANEKVRELKSRFTIELDLLEIKNDIRQISFYVDDSEKYDFTIKESKLIDVDLEDYQHIDLTDNYKYQDIIDLDEEYFLYLREIRNTKDGKYLGKLGIVFYKDAINDIVKEYLDSKQGLIFIKNRQGEIIFTNTDKSIEEIDLNEDYIIDEYSFDENGVYVTFYDNKKVIYEENRKLITTIILLIVLSLLLIITMSNYLTNIFIKPIKKISAAVNKVSQGDYSTRVTIETHDELKELGDNLNLMTEKIDILINEVYSKELHEKQARIAALTAQINPHFLYNTLDMVKSMAELEGVDEIGEIVKALSGMFRYATRTDDLLVPITDEIENVKNYIKIIDARFGQEIKFSFDLDESILDFSIIKLCLQPLVENAVTHGLRGKDGEKRIIIQVEKKEDLVLRIIDNGLGMNQERLKEVNNGLTMNQSTNYESIGLSNINRRLNLYYGQENSISITSEIGVGTTVSINIKDKEVEK